MTRYIPLFIVIVLAWLDVSAQSKSHSKALVSSNWIPGTVVTYEIEKTTSQKSDESFFLTKKTTHYASFHVLDTSKRSITIIYSLDSLVVDGEDEINLYKGSLLYILNMLSYRLKMSPTGAFLSVERAFLSENYYELRQDSLMLGLPLWSLSDDERALLRYFMKSESKIQDFIKNEIGFLFQYHGYEFPKNKTTRLRTYSNEILGEAKAPLQSSIVLKSEKPDEWLLHSTSELEKKKGKKVLIDELSKMMKETTGNDIEQEYMVSSLKKLKLEHKVTDNMRISNRHGWPIQGTSTKRTLVDNQTEKTTKVETKSFRLMGIYHQNMPTTTQY